MIKHLRIALILLVALGCKQGTQTGNSQSIAEPTGADNLAYKWGHLAIHAQALDTERFRPRPTVTSRYLGLISVAVFDAWSRYDAQAIPVYLKEVERRPAEEQNLKNKEIEALDAEMMIVKSQQVCNELSVACSPWYTSRVPAQYHRLKYV